MFYNNIISNNIVSNYDNTIIIWTIAFHITSEVLLLMRFFLSGFPSRPIPLKNNEKADQICSSTGK